MPNYGYTRNERVYFLRESAYGTTPNSSGTSSLAGSNCCSVISISLDPDVALYPIEYKTGSRGMTPGQPGRKVGTFSMSLPLKGSGVAGTPPDYSAVLWSAFGVETISGGTSVVYSIADSPANTFSLFRYRQPSTLYQQVGISCIPTRTTWTLGQNMANWSVEGQCFWVLDSEQFSTADTLARGGLTSFPTEPASPVTNGTQAQGFVGSVTADGFTLATIQQMTITAEWGWAHNQTTFGNYYPTDILAGVRSVTASIEAFDDDSSSLKDMRSKGISKSTFGVTATIGTTAGNIHSFALSANQISFPTMADTGDRFGQRFSLAAHESSPGSRNELVLSHT